jgi:hypothetical protein
MAAGGVDAKVDSTSDPRVVKRVPVSATDYMKTVPPFINQHGSDDDKRLADEALRISIAIRVLLGQFFLYKALTRSKDFARACDASEAKAGVAIVVGSLMRTMVVGIAALFDDDHGTNNIPKMLKMALAQERSEFLNRFHRHYGQEGTAVASRIKLIKYGRAVRKGGLNAAIKRLKHVRNTFVAHLAVAPANLPDGQRAIVHDFDHIIAAASIIVGEANVFVLGRRVNIPDLRRILREEAGGLVATLIRGFAVSSTS